MSGNENAHNQRNATHVGVFEDDPSIDEFPTQTSFQAFPSTQTPSFFGSIDGMYLEDQATWIIPAIQLPGKPSQREEVGTEAGTGSYALQLRHLLRRSGIYALSSLAIPLVSLLLAPFLTRQLSHDEYGSLAVINIAITLVTCIAQLGLWIAFLRAYTYDYTSRIDRSGVLSTTLVLMLLSSIPTSLALVLCAPWVTTFLLSSPLHSDYVSVAALVVLLQNLAVPGLAWMHAENRAALFTTASIANLLVNLSTTVILVGVWHMGVVGSLLGTACGYGLVVLCTLPLILLRAGLRVRMDIARGLLAFGLPTISSYVSLWVLQLADRFLLAHLRSLSETAIYTVAYTLGGVLSILVLSPFSMAWGAMQFTIARRDDAKDIYRVVFRWYSLFLFFAAYALALAGVFVLDAFFPLPYHTAAIVIPIVTLSTLFYGIYNFFTLGMSLHKKNWLGVVLTALAALTNIWLNLLFIPLYGSLGAALATLGAYVLLALLMYAVNQRIYPIPCGIGTFGVALASGVALYIGSMLFAQTQGTGAAWGIYIGALCLYGGCLLLLGKWAGWRSKTGTHGNWRTLEHENTSRDR